LVVLRARLARDAKAAWPMLAHEPPPIVKLHGKPESG